MARTLKPMLKRGERRPGSSSGESTVSSCAGARLAGAMKVQETEKPGDPEGVIEQGEASAGQSMDEDSTGEDERELGKLLDGQGPTGPVAVKSEARLLRSPPPHLPLQVDHLVAPLHPCPRLPRLPT